MMLFLALILKELLHILRDRRTLITLLALPVLQIILFGFALNTDVKGIRLAVIDRSHDALSQRLTQALASNPYFVAAEGLSNASEVETALRRGDVEACVTIPPLFTQGLLNQQKNSILLQIDAADPNSATIIESYLNAIIYEQLADAIPALAQQAPTIQVSQRMLFNPTLDSSYNFVPGVMGLVFIIICSIMTSVSIVREKEKGSYEVLLVSPIKSFDLILAKMVPYLLLSLVDLALVLLLATELLGVPIHGPLSLVFTLSLLYIFLALGLGLFISTICKDQASAIILSGIGMMLPTILLSGMIFPIQSMPMILRWIAQAVPARWYTEGLRMVMIQGADWGVVWPHHLVLALMALTINVGAILKLKPRLG